MLHDLLQIAFDWSDFHVHRFVIRGKESRCEPDWLQGGRPSKLQPSVTMIFGRLLTPQVLYLGGSCFPASLSGPRS
jgi:hypothetical protein